MNLYHVTKFSPYFSFTVYCFYTKISSFTPALSIRIALDCFYLLIFYSEKFSTDVCRLPYAVNVNLNLSKVFGISDDCDILRSHVFPRDVYSWVKAEQAFLLVMLAFLLNCTFKISPYLCFQGQFELMVWKLTSSRLRGNIPGSLKTLAWCPVCTSWLDQYFNPVESKFVKKTYLTTWLNYSIVLECSKLSKK